MEFYVLLRFDFKLLSQIANACKMFSIRDSSSRIMADTYVRKIFDIFVWKIFLNAVQYDVERKRCFLAEDRDSDTYCHAVCCSWEDADSLEITTVCNYEIL